LGLRKKRSHAAKKSRRGIKSNQETRGKEGRRRFENTKEGLGESAGMTSIRERIPKYLVCRKVFTEVDPGVCGRPGRN